MIDKQYALSQFCYKKKEYKQAFFNLRKALQSKVLAAGEELTVQVFPNTYQFQLLQQHLQNDEMFLKNNLLGVMQILRKIQDNHLPQQQKEKLYKFINESSTLYRDQHIVVRKKIALMCYFEEDFSEIIQSFIDQPRVQLKYFQQAFKLLADYLELFEEGIKVYQQYVQRNPLSIEGYDCLDAITDNRVALWQEFLNNNPHNQNGYARLLSLSAGNEAKILQLYILNNPDDLFGYEQLCLLEQDESLLDPYLEKQQSWLAYDKKCAMAFQIKRKFCPHILETYFEKHNKYPIILSELEQIKQSNQLISGYQLEKIKFYFHSINDSINQKLQNLLTLEQRKKLIAQNEIILEAIQLLVPLIFSIEEINQEIIKNQNDIKYYQYKANYFYQLNQLDRALQVFDDYILLQPNFKSYEEKAQFMKYKCKPLQIKQHWEKFIQCCEESHPEILLQKAEILTTVLKQHDKALLYFEKFLQLNPFSELGYLAKIKLLNDQGRSKELLKTIDEYLQINANNEQIQILKVQMLNKIYSNEVALQYIDTLNFKDSLKILELKARILAEQKKELGLQFIDELLENLENWKIQKLKLRFLRDYFGNVYIDHLRELIKQNPHNIKYYICFYKMTIDEHILYDEARDWIDRYIETHPNEKENHEKLKQLLQK